MQMRVAAALVPGGAPGPIGSVVRCGAVKLAMPFVDDEELKRATDAFGFRGRHVNLVREVIHIISS